MQKNWGLSVDYHRSTFITRPCVWIALWNPTKRFGIYVFAVYTIHICYSHSNNMCFVCVYMHMVCDVLWMLCFVCSVWYVRSSRDKFACMMYVH